jgi:hypothetical protein
VIEYGKLHTWIKRFCGPLLKSVPCASHNAGREIVWNADPVNEYEAQSTIIPFVGIMIQKEYKLRQQCHFIFISRHVATERKKES